MSQLQVTKFKGSRWQNITTGTNPKRSPRRGRGAGAEEIHPKTRHRFAANWEQLFRKTFAVSSSLFSHVLLAQGFLIQDMRAQAQIITKVASTKACLVSGLEFSWSTYLDVRAGTRSAWGPTRQRPMASEVATKSRLARQGEVGASKSKALGLECGCNPQTHATIIDSNLREVAPGQGQTGPGAHARGKPRPYASPPPQTKIHHCTEFRIRTSIPEQLPFSHVVVGQEWVPKIEPW